MSAPGGNRALLLGSEVEIFELLSEKASPRKWAEWLRAPLEYAALAGNFGLVTTLLGAGADASAAPRGSKRRSLIVAAACGGNEDVVQALLRAGGTDDLNAKFGPRGGTALHHAAVRGNEGAVRALLTAGADLNAMDNEGCGALYAATMGGHHVVVGDLLAHGACPNVKDNMGDAPLHLAAHKGRALTALALLEGGGKKHAVNSWGDTPVHLAVRRGYVDVAHRLLRAGADPNIRTRQFGYPVSPLHDAAASCNLDMVNLLIRHGADITAVDCGGHNTLHFACRSRKGDQAGTVCALLAAGVPIDSHTDLGRSTALHLASTTLRKDGAGVLALLQAGATVDCKDFKDETPLHLACSIGNVPAVEVLLRWGAEETAVNDEGNTPGDVIGTAILRHVPNTANNERVERFLARAPADRAWRRRSWLVLCRYYPDRARLFGIADSLGGNAVSTISSVKLPSRPTMAGKADAAVGEVGRRGNAIDDAGGWVEVIVDWQILVAKVVGLGDEDVFRTVVGFV